MSGLDCECSAQVSFLGTGTALGVQRASGKPGFSAPSHSSWPSKFSKIGYLVMALQGVSCGFLESTVLAKKLSVQSHAAIANAKYQVLFAKQR